MDFVHMYIYTSSEKTDALCTSGQAPRFVSAFMRHWGLAAGHNPNWALTPPVRHTLISS
jgi:hypothetical protein